MNGTRQRHHKNLFTCTTILATLAAAPSVLAAPGDLTCNTSSCSTIPRPLPNDFQESTSWDPCGGGPFRYYGSVHLEPGYDHLSIDDRWFEGYNSPIAGLAEGPVVVEVSTDGSVLSNGIQELTAECLATNTTHCSGTSCYRPAQPTPNMPTYAAECDRQIGVSVPAFNCAEGTLIPGQGTYSDGKCDNPDIIGLGGDCQPGSTFKRLYEDDDVVITAVCRKGRFSENDASYEDVAVIQHNRDNGATCFYQVKDNFNTLPLVPDPATGSTWENPNNSAVMDSCPTCHDAGALIRTPFVNRIVGQDQLAAFDDPTLNAAQSPYWLVGDFNRQRDYRHVSVSTPDGNGCTNCHRMGTTIFKTGNLATWKVSTAGTMRHGEFAVRPLDVLQAKKWYSKLEANSPYRWWMPPGRTSYDHGVGPTGQEWSDEFQELVNCRDAFLAANHDKSVASHTPQLINNTNCKTAYITGVRDKPALRVPDFHRDYQIRHAYDGYSYLYAWNVVGTSFWGAYLQEGLWQFEPSGADNVKIRNSSTGEYLCHASNSSGDTLTTCTDPVATNSDWSLEYAPHAQRQYRIASKTSPNKYLYLEDSELRFGAAPASPLATWWHTEPR